jgi:hypothetical protein
MINIIKFILFLFVLGISIIAVKYFDTHLILELYGYKIQLSLFFTIFVLLTFISILSITLKIIYKILNIPSLIYTKYNESLINQEIDFVLNSYSDTLISEEQDIIKLQNKLKNSKYKKHLELILANIENNFEKKLVYLIELSKINKYSFYCHYKVAKLMFEKKNYEQALISATKAFSFRKDHLKLNYLLIEIYPCLFMWNEFEEKVELFKDSQIALSEDKSNFISECFTNAARFTEDSTRKKRFLENAMRYNHNNIQALEYLCEINVTLKNTLENNRILEIAFVNSPSFDIFLLYKEYSNISKDKLYETLSQNINPNDYPEIFLAIAAYLKDIEKINKINISLDYKKTESK